MFNDLISGLGALVRYEKLSNLTSKVKGGGGGTVGRKAHLRKLYLVYTRIVSYL